MLKGKIEIHNTIALNQSFKGKNDVLDLIYTPGVAFVALDWDSCIADGAYIEACSVQVYQRYRSEQNVPAIETTNATSEGIDEDRNRDGRKDFTDKSDPIGERDCIRCMACVTVYPTQSIKVDEANLTVHDEMSKTLAEI